MIRERAEVMSTDLSDKVAIVTGAAHGIGRASAQLLASRGARVVIADLPGPDGEQVAETIQKAGGKALFVPTDVAVAHECARMVEQTIETYGRLDMAMNNAGTVAPSCPLTDLEEAVWDKILSVNLKGVFLCLKYEIPAMLHSGGAIVNVASAAGIVGVKGLAAYTASKHGVVGLTRATALDYAKRQVRVNAVCPGGINTGMFQSIKSLGDVNTDRPIGRVGEPNDIAHVALFLLSDEASFITGAAFVADGGHTAE
jgi:NAD(P)-dependent dehydrogenase (short-subunit alcohol dehydrogenase family)